MCRCLGLVNPRGGRALFQCAPDRMSVRVRPSPSFSRHFRVGGVCSFRTLMCNKFGILQKTGGNWYNGRRVKWQIGHAKVCQSSGLVNPRGGRALFINAHRIECWFESSLHPLFPVSEITSAFFVCFAFMPNFSPGATPPRMLHSSNVARMFLPRFFSL